MKLALILIATLGTGCFDCGHIPYGCDPTVKCLCPDAGVGLNSCQQDDPYGCDCADAGRR